MVIVEILLSFLAVATLVPVTVLFIQVLVAMPRYRPRKMPAVRRPSLAVLVPAHNEASGIADTLGSIVSQLEQGDRLLVVVDNCTDNTAEIAAQAGAEIIERHEPERRGKSYALDFGVRFLERNPPEVLICMDADCRVNAGAIDRLARFCGETARPVQALYLMLAHEEAGTNTRIAEFAWLVKNLVRPLGNHRLGLPCQLMGTGMAFPWPIISTTALASGHIVEDLLLGLTLTRSGNPPQFVPDARVTSFFPRSAEGIQAQRTRWEHGHLGMILSHAPKLSAEALLRGNVKLMALVLDLCVPPLALLMLLGVITFAGSAVFFVATEIALPLWLAIVTLAMLGSAMLLSWLRYGRQVISLTSLFSVPLYLLRKVPLYVRFIVDKQIEWVRSKRDES